MKLFSSEQMRSADRDAVAAGIPSQILMERAGQQVAEYALSHWPAAKTILVLCGKGNNGGDAYVAARYLRLAAKKVVVLELARTPSELSTEDARTARAAYLADAQSWGFERLEPCLRGVDLIIDGLVGSGLGRPLTGDLAAAVKTINIAQKEVLSIDIPSGIAADQTMPIGPFIQASRTLQLAGPKLASVFQKAKAAFGQWDVADIGIPKAILAAQSNITLLDDEFVRQNLPCCEETAHKYSVGTVLVVAGSSRYLGAAEMACRAAYRGGAGLVTLAAETRLPNSWPEIIFETLDWSKEALQTIASIPNQRAQVRVLGPGLDERAKAFLPELIAQSDKPTVLDAGALEPSIPWFNALKSHGNCVLTPHSGEAARILNLSSSEVNLDPLNTAKELVKMTGAVVVLKGATTVIASHEHIWVSMKGHPGMATGGTGDILAGLIGSFIYKGDIAARAAAAVYVHGYAGELAAERYGNGLIATDLLDYLPQVVRNLLARKGN